MTTLVEQIGRRIGDAVAREKDLGFWYFRMVVTGKALNPCIRCGKLYKHNGRWLKRHYMRLGHWGP